MLPSLTPPLIPRIEVVHEIQEMVISVGNCEVEPDEVAHVLAWFPGALEVLLLLADRETVTKTELSVEAAVSEDTVFNALERFGVVHSDGQGFSLTSVGAEVVSRLCTLLHRPACD